MSCFWLIGSEQTHIHLQRDLWRGLIGFDEPADKNITALERGYVLTLKMTPSELDQLLTMVDDFVGDVLNEERRQLKQLDVVSVIQRGTGRWSRTCGSDGMLEAGL